MRRAAPIRYANRRPNGNKRRGRGNVSSFSFRKKYNDNKKMNVVVSRWRQWEGGKEWRRWVSSSFDKSWRGPAGGVGKGKRLNTRPFPSAFTHFSEPTTDGVRIGETTLTAHLHRHSSVSACSLLTLMSRLQTLLTFHWDSIPAVLLHRLPQTTAQTNAADCVHRQQTMNEQTRTSHRKPSGHNKIVLQRRVGRVVFSISVPVLNAPLWVLTWTPGSRMTSRHVTRPSFAFYVYEYCHI